MPKLYQEISFKARRGLTSAEMNRWDASAIRATTLLQQILTHIDEQAVRVIPRVNKFFDRVILFDNSETEYFDRTSAARHSSVPPTIPANFSLGVGDLIYVGLNVKFTGIFVDINTAATGFGVNLEFQQSLNGTVSWKEMSTFTDNTTNFTVDGTLTWTEGDADEVQGWVKRGFADAVGSHSPFMGNQSLYWIRIEVDSVTTPPTLDQLWACEQITPLQTRQTYGVTTGGGTSPGSDKVTITPGSVILADRLLVLDKEVTLLIPSHSGALKRFAGITIDLCEFIQLINGLQDCSPIAALANANQIKLADIDLEASQSEIPDGDITDTRANF